MIYIRICAYNAEKTIARAIDSIIHQTIQEWKLYVLNNGSKDLTGKIISEYVTKDSRIIPFFSNNNNSFDENKDFFELENKLKDGDYFASLDADDEYLPLFLENMLSIMIQTKADIAVCGTEMINGTDGRLIRKRVSNSTFLLETSEDYENHFTECYSSFCTVWGKLYNVRAAQARVKANNLPKDWPKAYGSDTTNVFLSVLSSQRVVVTNQCLHRYYISQKSVSYQWIPGRMECARQIYERTCELLENKIGYVSEKNNKFIKGIFMSNTIGAIDILLNSNLQYEEKLQELEKVLLDEVWKEAMRMDLSMEGYTIQKKAAVIYKIINPVLEQANDIDDRVAKKLIHIFKLCQMDIFSIVDEKLFSEYINCAKEVIDAIIHGNTELTIELARQVMETQNITEAMTQELTLLCSELEK